MKFLIFAALILAAIIAAAIFLPWWALLAILLIVVLPVAWLGWKLMRVIKKDIAPALKKVAEGMPRAQERLCSLPANEPFRGNGFAFTFPVPCEVSQMVIDDLEALMLKPSLDITGTPPQGILIVSTIPAAELKTKVNDQLESVFQQVQTHIANQPREGQSFSSEDFAPTEVGVLKGERRGFQASAQGKHVRGETVYLGDNNLSVAWALAGPPETFDPGAHRYRELASLIKRVADAQAVDVPAAESI